jgi:hypothetical protein
MPRQLTEKQIERQDEVDNAIFRLIQEISPVMTAWDMQVIGEVREVIGAYLKEKYRVSEMQFYPYVRRGKG